MDGTKKNRRGIKTEKVNNKLIYEGILFSEKGKYSDEKRSIPRIYKKIG